MRIGVVAMQGERWFTPFPRAWAWGQATVLSFWPLTKALAWASEAEEVVLHVDSKYALGTVSKGWIATKNVELIQEVRDLSGCSPEFAWSGSAGTRA